MSGHAVTVAHTAWLFGKLPRHGDFVARGIDQAMRDRLDTWLSDAMVAARAALGAEFEAAYDSAPPWRFVRHDAGTQWTGGALCPSIDSAGRRFPLLVARGADDAIEATRAAAGCEVAIYRAFDEALDADALWGFAEIVDAPDDREESGWWTEGNDVFLPARASGHFETDFIVTMLGGPRA